MAVHACVGQVPGHIDNGSDFRGLLEHGLLRHSSLDDLVGISGASCDHGKTPNPLLQGTVAAFVKGNPSSVTLRKA